MNLLEYKNRFAPSIFTPTNISEVNGYLYALQDLLKYMQQVTEFNPAKRMVDSVLILDTITETNTALYEVMKDAERDLQSAFNDLAGVNLGGDKVNQFLKEQIKNDPDDLKGVL